MKFWDRFTIWEDAEKAWEEAAEKGKKEHPLKLLTHLPAMPGITKETSRFLKYKAIRYLIHNDHNKVIRRYLLKKPFLYGWRFFTSLLKRHSYRREGDFFFYGIHSTDDFCALLKQPDTLLLIGFSYCHKPFECPSGRFTDACIHDLSSPICSQCFIGKTVHASPQDAIPLFIPTIHYIGEKILEAIEKHPEKQIVFLITACEMTLEMFGDFGNMAAVRGIGVRLDGRICNTMKAFELSEKGIKPGLTTVLPHTQQQILDLLRTLRNDKSGEKA